MNRFALLALVRNVLCSICFWLTEYFINNPSSFPASFVAPGQLFLITAMSSNHAVSYQSSFRLLLALLHSALSTYEIDSASNTAPRERVIAVVC